MRLPLPAAAAGMVLVAVGAAALIRGAVPQAIPSADAGSTGAAPIIVTGAYVRPPAPPTQFAAAYFTVYNTTAQNDTLLSVATGAGATAVLHTLVNGIMTVVSGGVTIPAHGNLVLSTGTGHVMIGQLFGTLQPGQTVNLDLTFATAGQITVVAPVIALGAPAPTNSTTVTAAAPTPPAAAPTTPATATTK